MRRLASILPALFLILLAQAPVAGQTRLAMTVGVNSASLDIAPGSGAVLNTELVNWTSLGLGADIPLSERWGLRLGARHSQEGGRFNFVEHGLRSESTVKTSYLELTAMARLQFPLYGGRASVHLWTGPGVAMKTSCHISGTTYGAQGTWREFSEGCDDADLRTSPLTLGWTIGGGFDFPVTETLSASPGVLYNHGLLDIDTSSTASMKHRTLTLQIGLAYAIR